uniref:Eukaryotic translation initiation factor 4 gamma 2 n=1 Tax=Schistosoma haematobium TaxID=6185 RepID=A0A094ZZV8_SCHHA
MDRWRHAGFKIKPYRFYSILNKLTAENFEQQGDKLLSLDITSTSLHVIAQLIYQKAINEPKFTSLYAQLCLKLCSSIPNFESGGSQSESGVLVAPTPSERSVTQPNVPGSAFMGHSSASSNSSVNGEFPFISGLSSSSSKNNNGLNTGEAKSWMELARMGEELCRQSPRDFCLLDNRNRIGESPISQFHGRPQAGVATANRRFLSSKNDLSHSNNIPHQGSKPNNTDSWTKRTEKNEVSSDLGWVRGVNPKLRNSVITLSNGISTTNSNLPPRMLRKLAAEAAGNLQNNSTSNVFNETKQPVHSEVQSFHTKSTSDNMTSISKNSASCTTSFIHFIGQVSSSDPFEPAYLQKERLSVSGGDEASTQKPVWSYPKCVPNTAIYGSSNPTLPFKPQSSVSRPHLINKPNFPDIQAAVQKPCNRKFDQVRSSNLNNMVQSSNNLAENNYNTTHAVDENRKIALRLLTLLGDSRDPILVKNQLNSSDFSRITTEVLAVAVLHLCEEGTNLKLAEAEPCELAAILVACAENLLHRDASTSFLASKDNRKTKPTKLSCHPLSLVWSNLLSKILCVTQLTYSKSKLALLSAALIWSRHISLSEFGEPLRGGKHHPLFLLVLQRLSQIVSEDGSETICISGAGLSDRRSLLIQLFQESELQMNQMVPEGKCPEESDKITASKFNDYLSNHPIDARIRASDYIHACLPVIYEYIHRVGIIDLGSLSSPPTLMAREKAAWECIVPHVLIEVLRSSTDRQLDALHDLQSFWVDKNMPKGFLFRCFMNLYNCELVCEDAFLSWKEEVNPSYPAKGQALFEVNRWLTWLETAEEEDEEDQCKSDSNEDHAKIVQESPMDSENSEASKSPNRFIDIESHNMPLALHPNSAALRS